MPATDASSDCSPDDDAIITELHVNCLQKKLTDLKNAKTTALPLDDDDDGSLGGVWLFVILGNIVAFLVILVVGRRHNFYFICYLV